MKTKDKIIRLGCGSLFVLATCLIGTITSCNPTDEFKDIGLDIAGPSDTAVSADGTHFYILNSDFEWLYNDGSILILDESGNKVKGITTPRLGRSLDVKGTRMIATFDRQNGKQYGYVIQYDLSDPANPVEKVRWELDCSPLSVAMHDTYDYFFIACNKGQLYVGSFTDQTLLKKIRSYGAIRKAMYLDTNHNRLFAFPTDIGRPNQADIISEPDLFTYDENGNSTEKPNEIPDFLEETKQARRQVARRYPYQFVIFDIAKEAQAGFPYRSLNDPDDYTALHESRWLYFELTSADGTPDDIRNVRQKALKLYRTNFWEAKPDPDDANSFYISHRGTTTGKNLVKVTVIGDLKPQDAVATADDALSCPDSFRLSGDKCLPFTKDVLKFERVYGFNSEIDDLHYPGDFDIKYINGQKTMIMNHFRDLVYWEPDERRFSITTKVLGQLNSRQELTSADFEVSYYTIAANSRGKAITVSFYGNLALLLNVKPGEPVTEEKRISSESN